MLLGTGEVVLPLCAGAEATGTLPADDPTLSPLSITLVLKLFNWNACSTEISSSTPSITATIVVVFILATSYHSW